jgi:hypothetical protein
VSWFHLIKELSNLVERLELMGCVAPSITYAQGHVKAKLVLGWQFHPFCGEARYLSGKEIGSIITELQESMSNSALDIEDLHLSILGTFKF